MYKKAVLSQDVPRDVAVNLGTFISKFSVASRGFTGMATLSN